MRGLKLREPAAPYATEAREQGLLINATQGDVLRVMPPITITPKEIHLAMKILDTVFGKLSKKSESCACSNH